MSVQAIGAVSSQESYQQVQDVQPKIEQVIAKPEFEPVEMAEGTKAVSSEAVQKQIENLNRLLTAKNTNVAMEYDSLSSPERVSIIDTESGKVLKELPAQAAVEIAARAREYIIGLMVDKYV